jgi:predicted nucleic-acid-binding Zn-ribbon protein
MMEKVNMERRCSKCGGHALARWESAKDSRGYWSYKPDWPDEEFILRICQTCGYEWAEECLK